MKPQFLAGLRFLFILALPTEAASFDCAKAVSRLDALRGHDG